MTTYLIVTAETVVIEVTWRVQARSKQEAQKKFSKGKRVLLSEKQVDVLGVDILSVEEEEA